MAALKRLFRGADSVTRQSFSGDWLGKPAWRTAHAPGLPLKHRTALPI